MSNQFQGMRNGQGSGSSSISSRPGKRGRQPLIRREDARQILARAAIMVEALEDRRLMSTGALTAPRLPHAPGSPGVGVVTPLPTPTTTPTTGDTTGNTIGADTGDNGAIGGDTSIGGTTTVSPTPTSTPVATPTPTATTPTPTATGTPKTPQLPKPPGDYGNGGTTNPTPTPTPQPTPSPTPTPTPTAGNGGGSTPIPTAPPPIVGDPSLPPADPLGGNNGGGDTPLGPIADGSLKFLLVNADTGTTITEISDGMTIDLAEMPTRHLAIIVEAPDNVESVMFGLDGVANFKLENSHNFSLGGDDPNQHFHPNNYIPALGYHVITAIPFTKNGANGTAGTPESRRITIIDSGTTTGTPTTFPDFGVRPVTPPPADQNPPVAPTWTEPQLGPDNPNNLAPSGTLNSAQSGTLAAPGYFVLRADVSDPEGNPLSVGFYANGQLIGGADQAPYMVAWTDVAPGNYQVTAKIFDPTGGKVTETAPLTYNIVPAPAGNLITVSPGQSIDAAASQAQPGDTVHVLAGTYTEGVKLENGGTPDRPITFIFDAGAVINASNSSYAFTSAGAKWIIVKGMTVDGCNNDQQGQNAAVITNDGWRLEDVVVQNVHNTGVGVAGNGVTLLRVEAKANGQNGISSPRGTFVLMKDSVIDGNNTDRHNPGGEGGGGKFARTDTVFVTGLHSFDNIGPGLWFDISNKNFVVTQSVFHNNHGLHNMWEGDGLKSELSYGPARVDYNLTYDNDGGGFDLDESEHVSIVGNKLINDTLELRNLIRSDGDWKLRDVAVYGNTFVNSYINTSQAGQSFNGGTGKQWDLNIDGNAYDNKNGDPLFRWGGQNYNTLSDVQNNLHFEANGQIV